jgi:hypothetical protein
VSNKEILDEKDRAKLVRLHEVLTLFKDEFSQYSKPANDFDLGLSYIEEDILDAISMLDGTYIYPSGTDALAPWGRPDNLK